MYDFSLRAGGLHWRPALTTRTDGRKRLALVTAPLNTQGLDAPHAIHPTTGQENPPREPQAEPDRNAALTDNGLMPEDRVTLNGQNLEKQNLVPSRHPRQATPSDSQQGASEEEAEPQTAVQEDETTDNQEAEEIRDLKQRDAEVKAHEQAHMAAGGGLVQGAASYTYEKGPDGAMYAVGGEVKIDTSPARTPDQTIRKAQQIRRAALAPAQPSATDRAVAAAASRMEGQARAEKTQELVSGKQADASKAASPEAVSPETATGAESDPGKEEASSVRPSSPFAAPAVQAYRAAAAAFPTAQAISTFV
jgi:hypothetical protein